MLLRDHQRPISNEHNMDPTYTEVDGYAIFKNNGYDIAIKLPEGNTDYTTPSYQEDNGVGTFSNGCVSFVIDTKTVGKCDYSISTMQAMPMKVVFKKNVSHGARLDALLKLKPVNVRAAVITSPIIESANPHSTSNIKSPYSFDNDD